jgi:acyl-coenzyme A thioesterase PaaI-like protein
MVFEKSRIVRSHFILAQADSLALAIINSDVALTGLANIKYRRPVRVGERLVARAEIIREKGPDKFVVLVLTNVGDEQVFRGKFVVLAVDQDELQEGAK